MYKIKSGQKNRQCGCRLVIPFYTYENKNKS